MLLRHLPFLTTQREMLIFIMEYFHIYQPEVELKGTELLEALYGCKTKQSQQHWGQHNLC